MSDFIDEDIAMDLADVTLGYGAYRLNAWAPPPSSQSSYATSDFISTSSLMFQQEPLDTEMAIDETLAQAYDGKRKFEVAFPPEPAQSVPRCDLKVCHACRPIYKERAWQSLDQIVNTTPSTPSQIELDHRRISDAATILQIKRPSGDSNANPSNDCFIDDVVGDIARMCRLSAHDDASDADDEKGFAREEEDSDTSAYETGDKCARYCRSEDLRPAVHPFQPLQHPPFSDRSPSPYSLEGPPSSRDQRDGHQQRDHSTSSKSSNHELTRENIMKKRLSEGRFEID